MDPRVLGAAFRIAVLILGTALLMLPFQRPGSAEQVATVLALAVGVLFTAAVLLVGRLGLTRPPVSSGDRTRREALNGRSRADLPRKGEEERDT